MDIRKFLKVVPKKEQDSSGVSHKRKSDEVSDEQGAAGSAPTNASDPSTSKAATPVRAGSAVQTTPTSRPASDAKRARRTSSSHKLDGVGTPSPADEDVLVLPSAEADVVNLVDSDAEVAPEPMVIHSKPKQSVEKKRKAPAVSTPPTPRATPAKASKAGVSPGPSPAKKAKTPAKKRAPKSAASGLAPEGVEAVARVEAAIARLPEQAEVKYTVLAAQAFAGGTLDAAPPNAGQKDLPEGHPDCLTGRTFVVSGVLDSLTRPQAEDFIKRHGGRVTQSVSGKTSFLVVGTDSGTSKTRQAAEKNVKLIDEDGLISLVAAAPAPVQPATAPAAAAPPRPPSGGSNQLWVDKYKPRTQQDLIGNAQLVATLRTWLQAWEDTHLRGRAAPAPKGSAGAAGRRDMTKKAALLSGPPGVGKTSSAHVIAAACGFEVVEVNASDTRSKSSSKIREGLAGKVANMLKELSTNASIGWGGAGGSRDGAGLDTSRRQVIVMDEVDGMSGGDRGGVQDLIATIKGSKMPIICICNDRYSQKLKSLRTHCLEMEFRKPTKPQMLKRLQRICEEEGLALNQAALGAAIEGSSGDVRMILGQMQMWRLRQTSLSYDEVKRRVQGGKDQDMSPFEAARKLMEPGATNMSLATRSDLVFQDMDLVPLLVQENYLNHQPLVAGPNEEARMKVMAKAADALSVGDVVNNRIRGKQEWSLMPFGAVIGTVFPATYAVGPRTVFGLHPAEQNFPRFTAWLGNNSTSSKQKRLLGELTTRVAANGASVVDRSGVRLDYCAALRLMLTKPVREKGEAGIPEVIALMQDYNITKEEMDFVLSVTQWKSKGAWAADPYKPIDTKVKSALTRQFNQQGLTPKCNIMVEAPVAKRKGKGTAKDKLTKRARKLLTNPEEEFLNAEDAAVAMEEDEEEVDRDELVADLKKSGLQFKEKAAIKAKPRAAAKGKPKARKK